MPLQSLNQSFGENNQLPLIGKTHEEIMIIIIIIMIK